MSAGIPTGPGVPAWVAPASVTDRLDDLEAVAVVADPPTGVAATDTASVQAAVNTADASSRVVLLRAGLYVLNAPITKALTGGLTIRGTGIAATRIKQTVSGDLFTFTMAGGDKALRLEGLSLVAGTGAAMATGAAVRLSGALNAPSITMRDVRVETNSDTSEFAFGVHMTNCSETAFENVLMAGLTTGSAFTGWYHTSSGTPASAVSPHSFHNCAVYYGVYGVRGVSATNPGIEGWEFNDCDFVATQYGVHIVSTFALTYLPGQVTFRGGHLNCTNTCLHFDRVSQVFVGDVNMFHSGTAQFIRVKDSAFVKIHDNIFTAIGAGNPDGVLLESPGAATGSVLINDNDFALSGATKYAVKAGADTLNIARILDNTRTGGAGMASLGFIDRTVEVTGNYPADGADHYETMNVAATVSVQDKRSSFIYLNTPGGATTITTITHRRDADVFTFKSDSTLTTIQHNAGILLRGGANFTFGAGENITLRRTGGAWVEVGRSA